MSRIILNFKRPSAELLSKFEGVPTPNLGEAMGKKNNMSSGIRPVYKGARLCGSAFTVLTPPKDNLTIHKALELAQKNDVLVIDTGDFIEAGFLGEVICYAAKIKGLKGIVTNGGVRDIRAIEAMDFPVFSQSICIGGTVKESFGSINVPVNCGGVLVNPGDIIVGDDDGVAVVPLNDAERIVSEARKKLDDEKKIMQLIRDGKSTMEVYGFSKIFEKFKVTYEKGD